MHTLNACSTVVLKDNVLKKNAKGHGGVLGGTVGEEKKICKRE